MVTVIAVLGILAVLGVALVLIATTQHAGAALDLQGVRAYHAARGGVEWGLYQVLRNAQPCAAVGGQTVAFGGNLAGFSATLQCISTVHEEGSIPVTLFTITSTACNQAACPAAPSATYVERQLRVTVGRP
jgi:MSHA biogenesis protein MshP